MIKSNRLFFNIIFNLTFSLWCLLTVIFSTPPQVLAEKLELSMAKQWNISEEQAAEQIRTLFSTIQTELSAGNDVLIRNFGKFHVQTREARKGRNPKTGAEIQIPTKRYPRFNSSEKLTEALNTKSS